MNDLRTGGRIVPFSSDPSGRSRGLVFRVCTANPFYAISAVLVFVGLRISFNTQATIFPSWALLAGLAGYTLLLAGMAFLLVRFGNVWDDIRTILLLVVLMFLVISVAFDEILSRDPAQGVACCLGGLVFAVVLSEMLLRGLGLRLPFWFRLPYHLFLGLFFLYPVAISPLLRSPNNPALLWALFGFSPAAGLLTLTLLPAIRRKPDYGRSNGCPWGWPLYPWVLFGVLGFGVCARSYYLCLSAQYSSYPDHYDSLLSSIFGPYFLVPFLFGVVVLLLEAGLAMRNSRVRNLALLAPAGLMALALVGHQPYPVYRKFLGLFEAGLGGTPAYLTLLAVGVFYAVAALRRVPHAWDGLTATFFALGVVGPETLTLDRLEMHNPAPLAIAAGLQLAMAFRRGVSARAVLASAGFAAALFSSEIVAGWSAPMRMALASHLALASAMFIGASFDDAIGRILRPVGALMLLAVSQMATFGDPGFRSLIPPEALRGYPVVLGLIAAAFGWLLSSRIYLIVAAVSLSGGLAVVAWRCYGDLRRLVTGLDHIAWGLVSFLVAALISLWKAGAIQRCWERRGEALLNAGPKPCPPDGLGDPS